MDNYDSDTEYVKQLAEPLFGRTKRIRIWINGDTSNTSYEVSINPNVLRTWNTILVYITSVIKPRFGAIRRLLCLGSKLFVSCFEDLCSSEKYVALGVTGRFKNLKNGYKSQSEMEICEKIKQSRMQFYCGEVVKQKVNFLRKTQKRGLTIIYVMVNGKNDQNPTKLVLSPLDIEAWSVTLHFLANVLDIPEGIQHICTLFGNIVEDPHSFQHGFVYIAVPSNDKFVNMDYMDLFQNWKSSFVMKIRPSCSRIAFGDYFKGNKKYRAKFGSKGEKKDGTNVVGNCVGGCTNIEDMDYSNKPQNRRSTESSVAEKCTACRSNFSGKPQQSLSMSTQSQKVLEGQVTVIGSKQYVISNKPCEKCEQIVDSDGKSSYLHYVGTQVCKTDGCCLMLVDPKTISKKTPSVDKRSLGSKKMRMNKFYRGSSSRKRKTSRYNMMISCYNANNQCTQTLSFPFCKHVGCQQQLSNKASKNTYTEDDDEKNLDLVDEMEQPMSALVENIEKSTSNSSKVKDFSIFSSHTGVCNKCNSPTSTDKESTKSCKKNTLAPCQSAACSPNNSCYSTNHSIISKHSMRKMAKEQSWTDCCSEKHSLASVTPKPSIRSKAPSYITKQSLRGRPVSRGVTPKQSIRGKKQSVMSRASVRSAAQRPSFYDAVSFKSGRENRESQKQIMEMLPDSTGIHEISSEPNLDCVMKCLEGIYIRNQTNIDIYGFKNGKSYKFSQSKYFHGDLRRSVSDISSQNFADENNKSRDASGCHCRCGDTPGRTNTSYAKPRRKSQDQTRAKDQHLEETQSDHSRNRAGPEDPDVVSNYINFENERRSTMNVRDNNSEKGKQNSRSGPQDQDNLRNYNNFENEKKNTLRERNRQSSRPRTPDQDNIIKYSNFENERKSTLNEKNGQSSMNHTTNQDNMSNYINFKNQRKSSLRESDRRSSRPRTQDQDNNLKNERKNTVWGENRLSVKSRIEDKDNISTYVDTENEKKSRVNKATITSGSPKSHYTENGNNNSENNKTTKASVNYNKNGSARSNSKNEESMLFNDSSAQKTDNSNKPSCCKNFKEIENSKRAHCEKKEDQKEQEVQQKFEDSILVNNLKKEKMFNTDETRILNSRDNITYAGHETFDNHALPKDVDVSLGEKKIENEKQVSYIKNPPKHTKQSVSDEELLKTISIDSIDSIVI